MKNLFAVALLLMMGVGIGLGTAQWRLRIATWDSGADQSEPTAATVESKSPGAAPKAVVDQTDFDFGTLDLSGSGSHDFVLSNAGDAPLKIEKGETSCRCTMSEIERDTIAPGESAKITISWKPTETPGPYRQTAVILTNDPANPRITLTISGRTVTAVMFRPQQLVFSRVTAGDTAEAEARLYCYLDQPMEITGRAWSDAATAQWFDAALRPLTAEELKEDASARSGSLVSVTLRPGLPQGPIRQSLVVQTNLESVPKLTLPIEGVVGSEITVAGAGWNAEAGLLNLGEVSRESGVKRRLLLVVRGEHRREVRIEIERSAPDILKVELGQPQEINQGAVIQVPLLVEVPKNSPPANHLGSQQGKLGEILLKTTHPHVPQLRLLVRFIVEG